MELRLHDGIYVNGKKVMLKGVCRHSEWPESGRTLSKAISIMDVNLMKDMNMNAVRMSHYPPDQHFLDVCDSLGLFVLDELTGWQNKYDTVVGKKLVKEMVDAMSITLLLFFGTTETKVGGTQRWTISLNCMTLKTA
jgi:beta-galactosidase/beta-glucuronidase